MRPRIKRADVEHARPSRCHSDITDGESTYASSFASFNRLSDSNNATSPRLMFETTSKSKHWIHFYWILLDFIR